MPKQQWLAAQLLSRCSGDLRFNSLHAVGKTLQDLVFLLTEGVESCWPPEPGSYVSSSSAAGAISTQASGSSAWGWGYLGVI